MLRYPFSLSWVSRKVMKNEKERKISATKENIKEVEKR